MYLSLLISSLGCAPAMPRIARVEPGGVVGGGTAGSYTPADLAPVTTAMPLPQGIPAGEVLVDGVPFRIGGGVVDVGRSMAGIQEPFKTGAVYHDPKGSAEFGKLAVGVPADPYDAIHLLAWSEAGPGPVPRLTVRIGVGDHAAIYTELVVFAPLYVVVTVLFRPFPWEVRSAAMAMTALENVFFLWFFISRRKQLWGNLKLSRKNMLLALCIFLSLGIMALQSGTGNLGLISRQRVQFLPYLFMLFM